MSLADYVAKYPRRKRLKETVEKYWLDEPRKPPGTLDSSLKKHTSLLNRLRTLLLAGPSDALIKEIDGLTLTKYLDEIVGAVVEGAAKGKGDSGVGVDIIVHLHTRLTPEFLPAILGSLLANFQSGPTTAAKDGDKDKEKEEKERAARQKSVIKILAELALIHAWLEGVEKGVGEVVKVLRSLMLNDSTFLNLPIITVFLKNFARAYVGPRPVDSAMLPEDRKDRDNGSMDTILGDETLPEGVEEMVSPETQANIRNVFVGYFNSASKTLVKGQMRLLEQDKKNHEAYIKSGEIFEDRQQQYEKMIKAVERLTTGVQQLADLLGLQMPVLPTSASLSKSGLQIIESTSSFTVREEGQGVGIWDDEEEKKFYEELVDLKQMVPAGLLGIKGQEKETMASGKKVESVDMQRTESTATEVDEDEKQRKVEEDIRRQLEEMNVDDEKVDGVEMSKTASASRAPSPIPTATTTLVDDDIARGPDNGIVGEEEGLQSGPAARLTALFAALPDAVNREMIDKLAVEFAFLNSKAARNRLIKFLVAVPNNRTDLLPHYARFIATLDQYMPDVGSGVVELLEDEMRYLQRKRTVRELDSLRLKNCRFYGELAKFKVARPYAILHVLKVFLDEFKFNVDNISNLLETCGRFLLRNPATAETAKSMIELMRRKQETSHLDHRQIVMLENAFYQCNPPERVVREVVEVPPMLSFIQHLLHDVLIKRTLDKVLKLLRKLHWEDPEVNEYILRSFTEIWEIKFGNIPFVAALVYDLQRYHPEFSIAVVDQVMEDIRLGMEENIFKHNQRRISSLKYLGELYMYRVVNASVIFETLWSLISFGHPQGLPVPGRDSPIDAVDDFFRIRLVCTLLDACGMCFDRGSQKRKLDHFLTIFQLYVLCKNEIPMDVEFMLTDTLDALRPKTPRFKSFAEAAGAVDILLQEQASNIEAEDSASEDGSEGQGGRGGQVDDEDEEEENANQALETGRIDDGSEDDDDETDSVVVIRERKNQEPDEYDENAKMEFDREFAKMLADTTDARRGERKNAPPIFDTAVPHIKRHAQGQTEEADGSGGMQFSLMLKKGNRQQMREIDIPLDSAIAVNSRTHRLQSKAEQEQLKKLVLQNERRQGQSEMADLQHDMRNRGIRMRYVGS